MKLELAELDFDSIKQNLKNFLSTQREFQDYNFEGSSMSVLLDVLSYTTHYMSFYGNMISNEMFLDSALMRNSIISKAKELNYLPSQNESSLAHITIQIDVDTPETESIHIPKYTRFTGQQKGQQGKSYDFVTLDSKLITPDENGLFIADLTIYQGTRKSTGWDFDEPNDSQKFIITDRTIDIEHMTLTVSGDPWSRFDNIVELEDLSEVYFIQEIENYNIEIYFGRNILGKNPNHGNIISIDYLSTNGASGNGCEFFELLDTLEDDNGYQFTPQTSNVSTIEKSYSGKNRESNESIQLVAPKNYEMQSRAVTKQDYFAVVMNKFNDIESINIWGGEDNDPPEYGKVFISIKPKSKLTLSPKQEEYIKNDILNKYNMIAVVPEIITPTYTYVVIDTTVYYEPNKSKFGANQIMSLIEDKVRDYFEQELNKFDTYMKYSKLVSMIDVADQSISNNLTELVIYKELITNEGQQGIYTVTFDNQIIPGKFSSELYLDNDGINKKLTDDGEGNLVIKDELNNVLEDNKGVIDYSTGKLAIQRFTPKVFDGTILKLYVDTTLDDIYTKKNNLIILDDLNIDLKQIQ